MEPAGISLLMMTSMLVPTATMVAPVALLMSGDFDRERIARGAAQVTVMGLRSMMDITYDDILMDDRTGDFSLRGLEITLPESAGLPGCSVTIEAVTILPLNRPDALAFSSEGDGIVIDPACAAEQGAMLTSLLGPDAMNITHYSSTGIYEIGSSTYDFGILLETAAAGSVSVNARVEGLYLALQPYGDPAPAGEVTALEVTLQDSAKLLELLPVLGIDADPVAMATGTLQGALAENGISDEEQALIDSARAELGRFVSDGGPVTLRSGPGISVPFEALANSNGPQDMVPLFKPVFSAALPGADDLVSSDLLTMAMQTPGDLDDAQKLRVATALATGEGAPRATQMAARLLKPLAEAGSAEASLHYARLLHDSGDDPNAAYRQALLAGAGEAVGARSLLDRIEADMALSAILDIQAEVGAEDPELVASVSTLRDSARRNAQGRGVSRNYGHALLMATLAGAAGDRSARLMVERLSRRFAEDEEAEVWHALEAKQADRALMLWSEGFGDEFGAK